MTVKELIEELKKYDEALLVKFYHPRGENLDLGKHDLEERGKYLFIDVK